ncbi:MAG: methyltransferase [Polyangiales bacterium]
MTDLGARYAGASALLASVRDVVDERPEGDVVPAWAARRGWADFLAALSEEAVDAAEREGLAAVLARCDGAPSELAVLARAVTEATVLPVDDATVVEAKASRRASPRKSAQVAAFGALASRVAAGRSRVVDVGSGHGHLTRHLAEALGVAAEGWERDPARVAVARALTNGGAATFVVAEAGSLAATLRRDDVVVGLHACGALGDLAVRAAAQAGAAVALVGCCLQKRDGARDALAGSDARLTLGRGVLGLGNARDGDDGVEDDLATRTRSRVQRRALAALLREAGHAVAAGEEMRGVNRRRATGDFGALVGAAFGRRGLGAPTEAAAREALAAAWRAYAVERRMALPRAMLARLVEVWVALDRAEHLRRGGYEAQVVAAFDASVSPRNVAVLGA